MSRQSTGESSFSERLLGDVLEGVLIRYEPASRSSYRQIWNRWCEWLGKSPIDASPLDAAKFIDEFERSPMTGKHVHRKGLLPSRATVKKHVIVLFTLYKEILPEIDRAAQTIKIVEARHAMRNPFEALFKTWKRTECRQVRPCPGVPSSKVMLLVEAPLAYGPIGLRDAAFLAILFGGGLRISEAIKLDVSHIEEIDGALVLVLLSTKNHDDARQTLPDWAADVLRRYIEEARKSPLFANVDDGPLFCEFSKYGTSTGRRASKSTMYRRFKYWAKYIGLPRNVSPHSARHAAITQLLDAGLNHRDVQAFSRHKSTDMVARYDSRRLEVKQHPGRLLDYRKNVLPRSKKGGKS